MRTILTYMNTHEGSNVSWEHYCDLVYVTWCNFDQLHAHTSRRSTTNVNSYIIFLQFDLTPASSAHPRKYTTNPIKPVCWGGLFNKMQFLTLMTDKMTKTRAEWVTHISEWWVFVVGLRQARSRNLHGKTEVTQTQREVGLDEDITWVHITMNDCWLEDVTCQTHALSLGTTVFRGKFLQIPRTSLPNSAAHRGKFSTYSN